MLQTTMPLHIATWNKGKKNEKVTIISILPQTKDMEEQKKI